jgi:hypothetical protein
MGGTGIALLNTSSLVNGFQAARRELAYAIPRAYS